MAAGMVSDRHLLSGQVLRPADRRVGRHHDAARRDHVGFPPHLSDLLGGGLIHRPVAGAGNVRLDALVAFALLVGFNAPEKTSTILPPASTSFLRSADSPPRNS